MARNCDFRLRTHYLARYSFDDMIAKPTVKLVVKLVHPHCSVVPTDQSARAERTRNFGLNQVIIHADGYGTE
jgi:hypothetical protein